MWECATWQLPFENLNPYQASQAECFLVEMPAKQGDSIALACEAVPIIISSLSYAH